MIENGKRNTENGRYTILGKRENGKRNTENEIRNTKF